MKYFPIKSLIISLVLLLGAGLAWAMKPIHKIADDHSKINLETLVPKQFGDWRLDEKAMPVVTNPEVQAVIDKIYNQTLTRTYINAKGERIMLSIAYGGNQSDGLQVHKPEVCYPAQGFQIFNTTKGSLPLDKINESIPVKRLVATQGERHEPITYWTTVGDQVALDGLQWRLAQLRYGLTGNIPDGLLFRISSIDPDDARAFALQDRFVNDLMGALNRNGRARLIGKLGKPGELGVH
ncbi:MAG: exosortase-associated protein EpsI, B-type [Burkholderiales bacterium]